MGTTTLAPGETTDLTFSMNMHQGMGGMHLFQATVNSNDPAPAGNIVQMRANYIE